MGEYRKLDMNKLNQRIKRIISSEDPLKDIAPIEWDEEILSGKKKIQVTYAEKDYKNKCVKLEISY